jgi:hypothetical protein
LNDPPLKIHLLPSMANEVYVTKNRCKQIGTPGGIISSFARPDTLYA